jgi:endonuclease/exonuclease/phosphatase family metal-dependent hydrolase
MRIRLATLNAWALPEPLGRDVKARLHAIGERLPTLDLDVIAFQEIWTKDAAKRLRKAGRAAGLEHCWFDDDTFAGGGLLVLSRLPIDSVHFEPFEVRGEAERVASNLEFLSGKGFATIQLATPAGPFLLVNTHLHARYRSMAAHRYVPHRTGQAVQITSRFIASELPMAAVGDFNLREGEAGYRVFTDILGLEDVAALLDNRQNTTLHSNPYRNPLAIDRRKDFVFVRNGREQHVVPRSVMRSFDEVIEVEGRRGSYSNHAGLVVDLELTPAPATPAVSAGAGLDAGVYDLAAQMLAEGERLSRARQSGVRQISAIGIGLAAVAALGAAPKRMSRRRLLRSSLSAGALLALTPGLGFSVVSEVLVPDQIRAFRHAAAQLAQLRPVPQGGTFSS